MNELKSLGLNTGPITPTTRWLFEKRLSKARGCDVIDSSCENKDLSLRAHENVVVAECRNSISDSTDAALIVSESPAIFYGVCFDVDRSSSESASPSLPAVFTSKDEALKAAKKVKGARFKGFKSKQEALRFSRSQLKEQEKSPAPLSTLIFPTDPVSNFKSPTPQQLVKFRAVIERGSSEEFQEVVLTNPRYLIGPGDTPVILQEGSRYNSLHVAVKNNRKEMCQLIIETLESQHFWNILLNQETQSAMNSKGKQFLVDMYLNTPDKGNWETPLHFACKFGHADIVEYLVSHPLTDVQRTNKYGESPAQVICSRCTTASSELKNQIRSYLEDSFYVPLMGSMDNSTPPWISGPWSPEVADERLTREGGFSGSPLNTGRQRNSPGELPITVRAYAGPMSPSKLEQRNSYIQIKRKDDSRGVERIGRELAHNGRIAWTEYWNFLGGYADLSSSQGLDKLDDYLAKKNDRIF
ncbi:LEM domain [Desmophyllum pertusum]|uniref:LEM domain n=1 Tax=Desmophyllum pertusum TaxID=174260 RepID=A0A9X0D729_9CNID|nr:LEM domain [Desmophyllum pertusum]